MARARASHGASLRAAAASETLPVAALAIAALRHVTTIMMMPLSRSRPATALPRDGIPVQPMAPTRSHQLSLTLRLEVKLNTHSETVPVAAAAAAADDTESPAGGA